MEWLPIETAPKDGTEILLFTDEGEIRNGSWVDHRPDDYDEMGHDAGWQSNCGSIVPGRSFGNPKYFWEGIGHPTHWMPLPEEPKCGEDVLFQFRVAEWMLACFGKDISADRVERNHRFLEEALELVQANGCTQSEAHQLVDYVFNRPVGELEQEVGGVMLTLAALCGASDADMHECGDRELARVWTCIEKIRAKQAAKPKHSLLPGDVK